MERLHRRIHFRPIVTRAACASAPRPALPPGFPSGASAGDSTLAPRNDVFDGDADYFSRIENNSHDGIDASAVRRLGAEIAFALGRGYCKLLGDRLT